MEILKVILVLIASLAGGVYIGIWCSAKKKNKILPDADYVTDTNTPPTPIIKQPVPQKINILMEVVLVNNKTDKQYIVKTKNEFGLKWEIMPQTDKELLIIINQRLDYRDRHLLAIGRFSNFSIIDTVFEEKEIIIENK
jgi:hypothetical protein